MTAAPAQTGYENLKSWLQGAPKVAGTLPEKDDDGKPATEGARSAENTADIKKHIAPGQNIDASSKNPVDGSSDKPIAESGLMQTTTGKMPEIERAVKTVTEENEKAAAADLSTDAGLTAAIGSLEKIAAAFGILTTASATAPTVVTSPEAKAAAVTPNTAAVAQTPAETAKSAADAERAAMVADYVKFGSDRGALVGEYLRGFYSTYEALTKAAADGSLDAMAQDPAAAGGDPAMGGAPMGAPPGGDPAAAMGAPPGGDPGAGGDPAAGGAGGGAPSTEELAAALAEMGVTPDQLIEVAQQMQGSVEGAGAPPEQKAAAVKQLNETIKVASEAKAIMQAGKFRLKPAADGSSERKRREAARDYVTEMFRIANR